MAFTAEIRMHNGAPTLFLDGKADTGLMFWHSRVTDAGEDIQRFAGAGVHLFTSGLGAKLTEDGWSTDGLDRVIEIVLEANPDALFLPRVPLEAPAWWIEQHPDHQRLQYDVNNGDPIRKMTSFGSRLWREEIGARLPELVRYCEERWGEVMLGYHLCAGACGEWSHAWDPVLGDYSPAQTEAFRAWLRERYNDDTAALRAAWNDPEIDFSTAAISRDRARNDKAWPAQWSLFDPGTERAQIDYLIFHSECVADTLIHFGRVTRQALDDLSRRKLIGVFYGYHFFNARTPWGPHNAGHHAACKAMDSPDIDFYCSPLSYHERQPGGMYYSHLMTGSIRLRGKLYYDEDDTFTHRAKYTPWRYCCPDEPTTANLLWRNLMGTFRDGGTLWWMDHDGDGWYRDDALMAEIKRMREVGETWLEENRIPSAEIAVICSPWSNCFLRYDDALVDALHSQQLSHISAIGAPYDVYSIEDLDRLLDEPWGKSYKLFVFLDALYVSKDERKTIAERLATDGRTLLWLYAGGILTDNAVDPEAMRALTGFGVEVANEVAPILGETHLTGTRLSWGTERYVGPLFVGNDKEAEVLGWELHRGRPILMRRRHTDWTSVWCGAPTLPAAVLRVLARDANVHIYADGGDRIFAERHFLTVHAGYEGTRTIRLPEAAKVTDLRHGNMIAEQADSFDLTLPRGETAVFKLDI